MPPKKHQPKVARSNDVVNFPPILIKSHHHGGGLVKETKFVRPQALTRTPYEVVA